MTRAPVADANAPRTLDATLRTWATQWDGSALLGNVEHQEIPDDRGHYHWLVRLRAGSKDVLTVWFALRQRTVHVEAEVVPAPEANVEAFFRYLLVKNASLREVHLALGPEDGVYLMTHLPVGEVTVERLDETVGALVHYADDIFLTAVSLGHPSWRLRPHRG